MSYNEHEAQLLGLGTPCSYPHCSLLDFLPFKCPHCPGTPAFCSEHFHPHCTTAHAHLDRVAPNCPLCSVPVAIPPGEDPNVRMERHISRFCEVMNASGRQQGKGGSKICARGKCGKVLFAPIGCDKCHKEFCPQHRFPNDHSCPSLTSHRPNTNSSSKPSIRPSPVSATASSSSAKSAPTALSRPAPSSKPKSAPSLSKFSIPVSVSVPDVFSKSDRRAKEERASRRKAMTERAKRGLLTEEEKLILAQEEAGRAQKVRQGGKECRIM
ncbi:uncharacterized protein BJ212DRAFT_1263726 [Suillus subaureus]|uniref:AN1-type domain-containing protein n=1 Tax=Suillus subaureus TaxID=48587 RepID=A0A9P7EIZ8_9AGAM|nr:uncharacterized protein BJ212DRAFT_1263726 [Suillus subaureus]KAG1822708.1 hypothetical protein BJ212DRAFT_1263726 [Suillus subaureus]